MKDNEPKVAGANTYSKPLKNLSDSCDRLMDVLRDASPGLGTYKEKKKFKNFFKRKEC